MYQMINLYLYIAKICIGGAHRYKSKRLMGIFFKIFKFKLNKKT